jgi:hypothetical protein
MNKKSKPIMKVDDDAKKLIIESLEGEDTGGFDIDSIYKIKDEYIIIEFLKCDTVRPRDSHPNRYWFKNKQKFLSLWELTNRLEGKLYLLNYEDSREQFKIMKVLGMDIDSIKTDDRMWNFSDFKNWFKSLNRDALGS